MKKKNSNTIPERENIDSGTEEALVVNITNV